MEEARALAAQREWRELAERLSSLSEEQLFAATEMAFLYADACFRTGQTVRALEVAERLEPKVRRSGERQRLLYLVALLGMILFESGRLREAQDRFTELLGLATEWQDEEFAARASNNLGVIANIQGHRDVALICYQRAVAAYQRLGYVRGLAQTHCNLGMTYRDLGFDREADAHFQQAIEQAGAVHSHDVVANAETERAALRIRGGDPRFGETLALRALHRYERIGDPVRRADVLRVLAMAARARNEDDLAAQRLEHAFAIASMHENALVRAEIQRDRGLLLRDSGDAPAAEKALLDAADHFQRVGAAAEAEAVRALARTLRG